MGRGSSEQVEQPVLNGQAGGSSPPRGSTYLYAVVRKEITSGALLSQFGHAITECLRPDDLPLPADTRIVVLGATKAQLEGVEKLLVKDGVPHKAIVETEGPLAGVLTAIGLLTRDRAALVPILGELRRYREPSSAQSLGADIVLEEPGRGSRG